MTRILVIEDETFLRSLLRLMLAKAGYEVTEAADGEEGIRAYRRQPADLVMCDLFMPGLDGLEVIRELRGEYPDARIIAISGGGLDGKVNMLPTAGLIGAAALIHKPFDQDELLAVVERVLQAPNP